MGLDIRWPIGLMFSLLGVLLAVWGLFTTDRASVNIIWGIVLLVFGVLMLLGAVLGRNKDKK